ncbi:Cus1p U2 snRNP protein [Cryptosporidium ryanae]|uniref:Cus1p U2 snRNP protein n=1 Tax=Cryptosporidium ryanae TaxID=515981 RepID=UPI00351A90BE|nr:Cus1p U2 snRNP protein [Cryptosporidium ryanae]
MSDLIDIKKRLGELKNNKEEYKKLHNKLKKERNKANKKNKSNSNISIKDSRNNNNNDTNVVLEDSNVEYNFEENIELKLVFPDAYKYLCGLEYGNKTVNKSEIKSSNEENTIKSDHNNKVEEYTDINMTTIMEDEEYDNEIANSEVERRNLELKNFKSKNNGILGKITIKELKKKSKNPELVEIWDTTANDPELLVFLKGYQGSVKVPLHWNSKRRYLQGKRGLERPPYKLPSYIEETNIAEIRALLLEEESRMTMKQKQRRKIRPKLNKMDIDYQVLHDAFFVYSTKPALTQIGELYYEGKEYEFRNKNIRPGKLSKRLKDALGLQPNWPPPWLIKMQKYGPPPSYPYLRVPGVNSQIPDGCQFGFKPGDWGKPPIDDEGKPIWGLLPPIDDEINEIGSRINIENLSDSCTFNINKNNNNNSLGYWGEADYHTNHIVSDTENERVNTSSDPNFNSSSSKTNNNNDISGINIHCESSSNSKSSAKSNIQKVVNPFLFNSNTKLNLNEEKGDKISELYTIVEQSAVNIDDNSIFPSSHKYNIT